MSKKIIVDEKIQNKKYFFFRYIFLYLNIIRIPKIIKKELKYWFREVKKLDNTAIKDTIIIP